VFNVGFCLFFLNLDTGIKCYLKLMVGDLTGSEKNTDVKVMTNFWPLNLDSYLKLKSL